MYRYQVPLAVDYTRNNKVSSVQLNRGRVVGEDLG